MELMLLSKNCNFGFLEDTLEDELIIVIESCME